MPRHFNSYLLTIVLAGLGLSNAYAAEPVGHLHGKVIDELNAITLPSVRVQVSGQSPAFTDMDGRYAMDLPEGTYELTVAFSGYKDRSITGVRVKAGQTTQVDVSLATLTVTRSEEVTVTAEADPIASTQAAAMFERMHAGAVSEGLAGEEMSRNADGDAAAAMQRVTGVSVVDGQYVFVRGLGERYSNTTLNGAVLPTTEPDKRVVPLDLFPSDLIESVRITKSYLPDKPAEFSGGLLEIQPISFPSGSKLSFSVGLGGNLDTAFKSGIGYAGGGHDVLGFDDGTRALPAVIPSQKVVESGIFGGGFTRDELTAFGRSFSNVWKTRPRNGRPDASFNVTGADTWGNLGVVASLSYSYKNNIRSEQQQFYAIGEDNVGLRQTNDYDFLYSTAQATTGVVANVAYKLSSNHRVAVENFVTHSGKDEARTFSGYQEDKGVDLRNTRLFWVEETIRTHKLSGQHFFPGLARSRADWSVSYSRADRNEPDLRETLYEYNDAVGDYIVSNESQSGFRMFNDLVDDAVQVNGDWSLFFTARSRLAQLKLGGTFQHRQRDFQSRRFRFKPLDFSLVDRTQAPETLFSPENIGTTYQLEEDTRRTDRYNADQDVSAGYGMLDFPLSGHLRFVGGARVEQSVQRVVTSDLFDPTLPSIASKLDNADLLPGANLIYGLSGSSNLRVAYSRTVNRPAFRELAPFEFTDIVGGRASVGNPELRRALIQNADLRWEWFPSGGSADGEVIALSAFWKGFTDPIERVVEATAPPYRTSYVNAKGARNLGFEVELRKLLSARWLVGANYTYVSSQVELDRTGSQIQTSLKRPLAGQSPNVLNALVEFRPASGTWVRVLLNWFDDRISDVGALGLPDTIENGRATLDVVASRRMGSVALRLAAENLTDAEYRSTIEDAPYRVFRMGRSVKLSLSYGR